ncbi:MAG: choice-of-anchor D domain-containing protein [Myxococcales bacterium]
MKTLLRALLPLSLSVLACSAPPPVKPVPEKKPGLSADPKWLTFQCVKPGCDTSQKVTVIQEGERRIAVKRIVLSDTKRTDFVVETAQKPPFVIPGAIDVTVRHVPVAGGSSDDVNLLVSYTDASADDSPDRVPAGELAIPLLRRLIGEPAMVASPGQLTFGAAWIGDTVTQSISIENTGYGNISLDLAQVESDAEDVQPGALPAAPSLLPGEKLELPVVFTPTASRFTKATITIRSVDPAVKPATIVALATSLSGPSPLADPAAVDFGEVDRRTAKTAKVTILNQGGSELTLSKLAVTGGGDNVEATLPGAETSLALQPLESAELTVKLTSKTPGEVDASVDLATNVNNHKTLSIPVRALVLEPKAAASPESLDFGKVNKGWTKMLPVTVENAGWGDLKVMGVSLVQGSSELFTLRTLPVLPATLKRGQRLELNVEFRADATAEFTGAVSVETNDPNGNFLQIPLVAQGTTCEAACLVANATPTCASGTCSIDACNAGWFDTNGEVEDGCECHDALDTGPFCADATNLGQMTESHSSASYQGVLPAAGDEDTIRFSADSHGWFGSHSIYVSLNTADPNIQMCVAVREGSDCPTTADGFTCGSFYPSDAKDSTFLVKVSRKQDAPPKCTPYTVMVSHY